MPETLKFYMDVHIRKAVTLGLRARGVDVLTAQNDNTTKLPDPDLMDRALALQRIVFTQDKDFLLEVVLRQRSGAALTGVVYAAQGKLTDVQCIKDLETLTAATWEELTLRGITYLPLRF